MTQTATDDHGQARSAANQEIGIPRDGHRVMVWTWIWKARLARPAGYPLGTAKRKFWEAAERQHVSVKRGVGTDQEWTAALLVEATRVVDLQIIHKRMAEDLLGEGIELVELCVEVVGKRWEEMKDE